MEKSREGFRRLMQTTDQQIGHSFVNMYSFYIYSYEHVCIYLYEYSYEHFFSFRIVFLKTIAVYLVRLVRITLN